MEFPELGQNCKNPNCKKLDFLPMKCDACGDVFCVSHYKYDNHNCPQAYLKNNQVPICPLCGQPVPVSKGDLPDVRVNQHIESDCQDTRAVKKRVYQNRCSFNRCKHKELVPITCHQCKLNFCLGHRHPLDHKCAGKLINHAKSGTMSKAAEAALKRASSSSRPVTEPIKNTLIKSKVESVQGNLTDDEALAMALQESIYESDSWALDRTNPIGERSAQRSLRETGRMTDRCCLT